MTRAMKSRSEGKSVASTPDVSSKASKKCPTNVGKANKELKPRKKVTRKSPGGAILQAGDGVESATSTPGTGKSQNALPTPFRKLNFDQADDDMGVKEDKNGGGDRVGLGLI